MRLFLLLPLFLLISCATRVTDTVGDRCKDAANEEWASECRRQELTKLNEPGEKFGTTKRTCTEIFPLAAMDKGVLREIGRSKCRYTHHYKINLVLHCKPSIAKENRLQYLPGIPLRFAPVHWKILDREGNEKTNQDGSMSLAFDIVTDDENRPEPLRNGHLKLDIQGRPIVIQNEELSRQPLLLPAEFCRQK